MRWPATARSSPAGPPNADELRKRVPARARQRISAGRGAQGQRFYDRAFVQLDPGDHDPDDPEQRWLLIRRNRSSGELAYYRCFLPHPVPLATLVNVAGRRWSIEERIKTSKGLCGLDQHQVRRWRSWYRWATLAIVAHAFLVVAALTNNTRHPPSHAVNAWAARLITGSSTARDLRVMPWGVDALDLLPGWYDDWALIERERVRQRLLHALEALSRELVGVCRCAEAVEIALMAVGAEPLRESAQRTLIEAHLAEGNWIEARRSFDAYRDLLDRELGVEPDPEVANMVRRFGRSWQEPPSLTAVPDRHEHVTVSGP